MAASGTLLSASSAHVHSLLEVASKLSEEGEHPVIHIQAQHSDVLISHTDGFTTAVQRHSNFTKEAFQAQGAAAAEQPATEPEAVAVQLQD